MASHYSLRTTVGFAFWAGGVISPLFFDDDEGATVSDNKDRYCSTISEVYGTLMYITNCWFQQERLVTISLKEFFCSMKNL